MKKLIYIVGLCCAAYTPTHLLSKAKTHKTETSSQEISVKPSQISNQHIRAVVKRLNSIAHAKSNYSDKVILLMNDARKAKSALSEEAQQATKDIVASIKKIIEGKTLTGKTKERFDNALTVAKDLQNEPNKDLALYSTALLTAVQGIMLQQAKAHMNATVALLEQPAEVNTAMKSEYNNAQDLLEQIEKQL